ncbi:MAG: Esa1p-associated factor [Cirrosporium novae-zelandiae]|nr:MAG: Esa1p-associated factor [Cirrosporium novae-zelandiae]
MAPSKELTYEKNERVFCFHHDLLYEAKILDIEPGDPNDETKPITYQIHYKGWKHTWDDHVPVERLRKFTDEHRDLANTLRKQKLEDQAREQAAASSKKKRPTATAASDFSSQRGSEDSPAPTGRRRAAAAQKDYEIEKVGSTTQSTPNSPSSQRSSPGTAIHPEGLEDSSFANPFLYSGPEDHQEDNQVPEPSEPAQSEPLQKTKKGASTIRSSYNLRARKRPALESAVLEEKPTKRRKCGGKEASKPTTATLITRVTRSQSVALAEKSTTAPQRRVRKTRAPNTQQPTTRVTRSQSAAPEKSLKREAPPNGGVHEPLKKRLKTQVKDKLQSISKDQMDHDGQRTEDALAHKMEVNKAEENMPIQNEPPVLVQPAPTAEDKIMVDEACLPVAEEHTQARSRKHQSSGKGKGGTTRSNTQRRGTRTNPNPGDEQPGPSFPNIEPKPTSKAKKTQKLNVNNNAPLQESNFVSRPSVMLPMSDTLKSLAVDDWEAITKTLALVPLPSKNPVNKIMDDYYADQKTKRREGSADMDLLEECVAGMKEYFHKTLGKILLYRFERDQYFEMSRLWTNNPDGVVDEVTGEIKKYEGPGDVYGPEHLLRLFASMPELIAQTTMDAQSVVRLREEMTKMLNWLGRHVSDYFVDNYIPASVDYIAKARGVGAPQ